MDPINTFLERMVDTRHVTHDTRLERGLITLETAEDAIQTSNQKGYDEQGI